MNSLSEGVKIRLKLLMERSSVVIQVLLSPDGHGILGSAPFVLIQVVVTGQGLNGAIGH